MKLHLHDVEVTANPSDFFQVIDGRYILCNDTLIVYQLDHRVIDLLKGDLYGKVNGLNIIHIPIESGLTQYSADIAELIKYIIFEQQNDIVLGNLFFINAKSEYHNKAMEAVEANARKITKNSFELFPKVEESCFNTAITDYHFTVGYKNDFHRSWFGEEAAYSEEKEEILMPVGIDCSKPPYSEDGCYYEKVKPEGGGDSDSGSGSSQLIQYKKIWIHEYYTISLKRFYSQFMGQFTSAVNDMNGSIVIKHTVRPDEQGLVGD